MEKQIKFVHTRTQQAIVWLIALLLIGIGVYLTQIRFLATEWLWRSGCLVVVLGIWSGLGGIIQERLLISQLEFRRRLATARTLRYLRAQRADKDQREEKLAEVAKEYDEQADKISDHLRLSIGILEVSLLVTGTLLWGFGDLLPIG